MKYRHTSRNTPADTQCRRRCQTKPANHQTRRSPREASCESPVFLPRPGWRQNPGPEPKQQRGEDTVSMQGNAENPQRQHTRPGLQHGGPRRVEPTEQGQNSGAEGPSRATRREAEDENNPQNLNATGAEEQPDYDTVHACATHGEASEHIGIHTTSNAHPDCPEATVQKPHGVTVLEGEPACDTHGERRQGKGRFQQPQALPGEGCRCLANQRQRAPYLYPARDGGTNHGETSKNTEPRIFTPPGTAAPTSVNQKNTQINAWKRMSTHEHRPQTR